MKIRRIAAGLVAVAAAVMGSVASQPAAQAGDNVWDAYPCYAPWWHTGIGWVQTCPDWGPSNGPWGDQKIPVYNLNTSPPSVVGTIYAPGDDWYKCQHEMTQYDPFSYGGYYNDWFAKTMADNGNWGWAPEVFFRGGGNNDPDRKLVLC
jgi:hypothetical protein